MDNRGLRPGHLISLAGAAVTLIALWTPWYSVRLPDALRDLAGTGGRLGLPPQVTGFVDNLAAMIPPDVHASAWQVFQGADVALAAGAVAVLAVLVAAGGALGTAVRVERAAAGQIAMWIGAAMAALVAYKLINPPLGGHYVHVLAGSWLALVGSACVCAGGWAATRDDRRDVG